MSDQLSYQFTMVRLLTAEFALIEKNYQNDAAINVNTSLAFAATAKNQTIAVGAKFTFEIAEQPFIIIKVDGNFSVSKDTWDALLDEEKNSITVPKPFMAHLAMLVVGSSRGVLHAKLENTPFNQFLIPTINVQSMILDAVKIPLEKIEEQEG